MEDMDCEEEFFSIKTDVRDSVTIWRINVELFP